MISVSTGCGYAKKAGVKGVVPSLIWKALHYESYLDYLDRFPVVWVTKEGWLLHVCVCVVV